MKSLLLAVLSEYVNGGISLEKLEDWYVPRLEDLDDNLETMNIIGQIELGLAEISDGLITEEYFKKYLKRYILNKKRKKDEETQDKNSRS